MIRPEGDVLFEYLELLPTLKRVIACASAEWPDERIKSGQSSTPAGRVERT